MYVLVSDEEPFSQWKRENGKLAQPYNKLFVELNNELLQYTPNADWDSTKPSSHIYDKMMDGELIEFDANVDADITF